ncbi:SMC-Scp complex subunit ScpB [Candidatus Campbellbacteria bacterium CG22_combo_CG10-13_8_21_14_all_36_13]|uniref:SMC-Scp complex subunit ScpB n=1 Tax=Candidatus Campbellbacteria bacterium CG22_combo_CG10-13_8_21_14_all_36_13 TaxID=1974529 RepID=A0A2H0DXD8_9BACT|nr:MAG: SMC-Scp complex subunit ScpB [Candidatus Campbellbacteria bacterium CG22_combo_CG10-13_8_21_14_all_36_13]
METNLLSQKIEAILFANGDPISYKNLSNLLDVNKKTLEEGMDELQKVLNGRGLILIKNNDLVSLGTSPETSEVIEKLKKEELERPLGKAGSETLSIVLYMGPVTKSDVNYIRGVDSSSILRNLLVRGLVERNSSSDTRGYVYSTTIDTLRYMGISNVEELPDYENIKNVIKSKMNR